MFVLFVQVIYTLHHWIIAFIFHANLWRTTTKSYVMLSSYERPGFLWRKYYQKCLTILFRLRWCSVALRVVPRGSWIFCSVVFVHMGYPDIHSLVNKVKITNFRRTCFKILNWTFQNLRWVCKKRKLRLIRLMVFNNRIVSNYISMGLPMGHIF